MVKGGECHKVNDMSFISNLVILSGKTLHYLNLMTSSQ